jgi:S1-C subfamily serine protease
MCRLSLLLTLLLSCAWIVAGCSGPTADISTAEPASTTLALSATPETAQPMLSVEPAHDPVQPVDSAARQGATPPTEPTSEPTPDDLTDIVARTAPAVVLVLRGQSSGAGFLIDQEGHILTSNHIIASESGTIRVGFDELFETTATIVGSDPTSDIAVLRAERLPDGVEPLAFGDEASVQAGAPVLAIGNPLGRERSVTAGIVSATGRTIVEPGQRFLIGGATQTDAAINAGNSGGPLLTDTGDVIGMNTAAISTTVERSGIGFAIPGSLLQRVTPRLIEQGSYTYPWLGLRVRGEVTTLMVEQNNFPAPGLLARPVAADISSPAREAGLQGDAILTAIDGEPLTSTDQLLRYLTLNTRPGDTVTLTVAVPGRPQPRDLNVQLGPRPDISPAVQEEGQLIPRL